MTYRNELNEQDAVDLAKADAMAEEASIIRRRVSRRVNERKRRLRAKAEGVREAKS